MPGVTILAAAVRVLVLWGSGQRAAGGTAVAALMSMCLHACTSHGTTHQQPCPQLLHVLGVLLLQMAAQQHLQHATS